MPFVIRSSVASILASNSSAPRRGLITIDLVILASPRSPLGPFLVSTLRLSVSMQRAHCTAPQWGVHVVHSRSGTVKYAAVRAVLTRSSLAFLRTTCTQSDRLSDEPPSFPSKHFVDRSLFGTRQPLPSRLRRCIQRGEFCCSTIRALDDSHS